MFNEVHVLNHPLLAQEWNMLVQLPEEEEDVVLFFFRQCQESVRCPVKSCIHKKHRIVLMDFIVWLVTSLSVSLQPFETLCYSASCWANTFWTLWQLLLPYSWDLMFLSLKCRANICGLPLRSLCPRLGCPAVGDRDGPVSMQMSWPEIDITAPLTLLIILIMPFHIVIVLLTQRMFSMMEVWWWDIQQKGLLEGFKCAEIF